MGESTSVDYFSLNGTNRVGEGGGDGVATLLPSSADNSVAGANTKKRSGNGDRDRFATAVTEAEEDWYSRFDVTVINTSALVWRSKKVIFRKGSMWKEVRVPEDRVDSFVEIAEETSQAGLFPHTRSSRQLKSVGFAYPNAVVKILIKDIPNFVSFVVLRNPKFFTTPSSTNKSDAGCASNQNSVIVLTVEKVNCSTVASGLRLYALRAKPKQQHTPSPEHWTLCRISHLSSFDSHRDHVVSGDL
ncbi:hypothetical protein Sjap_005870 [Stephania japonica]|uniref:Uncharacterized protein n=1 Tax=Stephania japonica TaxID=461633 RepID=A0AAP0K7B0_9MAGN